MRRWFVAVALVLIAGCAALTLKDIDSKYGPAAVRDRHTVADDPDSYEHLARSILDRRCLVCHACYDAPCQLKMESFAGVDRGASPALVYDAARLEEAPLTRLGIDAQTTARWRAAGFSAVLNERTESPANDRNASVLYRMLALKSRNPLPTGVLPAAVFDFSLGRAQTCPTLETMPKFEREHPQWGMPFGLPALSAGEMASLARWLESGAKSSGPPPLPAAYVDAVGGWETFLNGDSAKARLMSRYLYEHLFLADLYFDALGTDEHFRLVRSATPPGQPIEIIATRRPYDDPGVERPYYRLERSDQTLVSKTHMAYALNPARMRRWTQLFMEPAYAVDALPDYKGADASNPFLTYRVIPVKSRYQFMIDEAQYTIMGFIKGPVCRGQIALDVIEDQFWVWFVDPEIEARTHDGDFLASQLKDLTLPASLGSNSINALQWLHFAEFEKRYLIAKSEHERATFPNGRRLTLDVIWDGDGVNQNAALTVFRHFDSATVVKGLVGEAPKTAWVIDYPLLERIHYLLVAGYDVYGNADLQLFSRLYMDFLRIGGEFNFLYFLPPDARTAALNAWYRGAEATISKYLADYGQLFNQATGIRYTGGDPQHELYAHLERRVANVRATNYDLAHAKLPVELNGALMRLAAVEGMPVSWLPELSILRIASADGSMRTITLVHNDGHSNVASMFGEAKRRLPAEDTLTVVPGFLGAYPNAFFKVRETDVAQFVDAVEALSGEADVTALMDRFGVRRSDPEFWRFSDSISADVQRIDYPDRGVLDYGRIENR